MALKNLIEARLERMYLPSSPISVYKSIKVIGLNFGKDYGVVECLCKKQNTTDNSTTIEFAVVNKDGEILMPFCNDIYYMENLNHNKFALYKKSVNGEVEKEICNFEDLYSLPEFIR